MIALALFAFAGMAQAQQGPGLGNLTYSSGELFNPIYILNTRNGVPTDSPGGTYGLNTAYIHNGYLLTLFAPDSGGGPGGWLVIDVSDPRKPNIVNTHYNKNGDTSEFRESHSMGFYNNNGNKYAAIQSGRGIEIWDFTDSLKPSKVSKLAISGVDFGDYGSVAWQLFWQAPYLYVALANQGIAIIDASDVANPSLVKVVPTSQTGGFRVGPIFAIGNQMIISNMDASNGISVLDISDPENPSLLDSVGSTRDYYATCIAAPRIYTASRGENAVVSVYNFSDPSNIVLEDDDYVLTDQLYCATQDNYLFEGAQSEVVKIDTSNPTNMTFVGTGTLGVSNPDHGQVSVMGNLVFIGNDHGTGSGFIPHSTSPDNTAPALGYISPADGASLQSLSSRIGIQMTDMIQDHTVNSSTFQVSEVGGSQLTGSYSTNAGIINFSPDSPLSVKTTYEVKLTAGGVTDYAGNGLATEIVTYFSTGSVVDSTADPKVILTANAATTAGTNINFSAVGDGTGTLQYSWNFGDGTSTSQSTNPKASHTYASPGHYTVVVTAQNPIGIDTDIYIQTIHNPITAGSPTNSSTIVHNGSHSYNVNPDNDSVTKIDGNSHAKLWERAVGDNPRTLAIAPSGDIWVVNQGDASISVLTAANGSTVATYSLPYASAPYGIAFSPDGSAAYVTLQATGKVVKVNSSGSVMGTATVGGTPRGVAVSGDSSRIFVTQFISPQTQAEVYELNASMAIVRTIPMAIDTTTRDGENRGRGIPNYLSSLAISPDGRHLVIPSKKDNVVRGQFNEGQANNFESTVRTVLNFINLSSNAEDFSKQVDFNDRDMAQSVAFSPLGDYAFVGLQGSNSVEVVDTYDSGTKLTILKTGDAPQGLAFNSDASKLFVHNFLSRTVRVYNTSSIIDGSSLNPITLATTSTVANEDLASSVLAGKKIFSNAIDRRMSKDGYISCASCHFEGGSDERVWDFTDRGEGLRNTISLKGRRGTGMGNIHWTARFDEIQDFESEIRNVFGGAGFMSDTDFNAGTTSDPLGAPKAGKSVDLDNLANYVSSLKTTVNSPYRNSNGTLTSAGAAGKTAFAARSCNTCHSGADFTDGSRHDVGTIQSNSGQGISSPLAGVGFDTPTLKGLWLSAPYLHNGQAATLGDVLNNTTHAGSLSAQEKGDIEQYLLSIDDIEAAPPVPTSFRYVRFVATSEVGGNAWASVAEIWALDDNLNEIPRSNYSVSYYDSQETAGENAPAIAAIDGNTGTFWHTRWQRANPTHPHEIQIDLGLTTPVCGFSYVPRQSGSNGRVADYQFYISTDGVNWNTPVASGTFPNNTVTQTVTFDCNFSPVS